MYRKWVGETCRLHSPSITSSCECDVLTLHGNLQYSIRWEFQEVGVVVWRSTILVEAQTHLSGTPTYLETEYRRKI